jgi:hypothetical protein
LLCFRDLLVMKRVVHIAWVLPTSYLHVAEESPEKV